jgi:hypothetical protein
LWQFVALLWAVAVREVVRFCEGGLALETCQILHLFRPSMSGLAGLCRTHRMGGMEIFEGASFWQLWGAVAVLWFFFGGWLSFAGFWFFLYRAIGPTGGPTRCPACRRKVHEEASRCYHCQKEPITPTRPSRKRSFGEAAVGLVSMVFFFALAYLISWLLS